MPKLFPIIDALTPSLLTVALVVMAAIPIVALWKLLRTWRNHEADKQAIAREQIQAASEHFRRAK